MNTFFESLPNVLQKKVQEKLIDRTTVLNTKFYPNKTVQHPFLTYMGCLMLRFTIATLILSGLIPTNWILGFSILVVIMFGSKWINNDGTWKNYYRTVALYSIITLLIILNKYTFMEIKSIKVISGLLIILDAIMGQQTRYIASTYL